MKKEIKFNVNNDELILHIKSIKNGMIDMEEKNKGIFGDELDYKRVKSFNQLEEFEKNILCIYTFAGSYEKMEDYLSIKKSAIANEVNRIKTKMFNFINII